MQKFLLIAVSGLALATSIAAQEAAGWRLGAVVAAPTKLLDAKSFTLPDSVDAQVKLGIGLGLEGGRNWKLNSRASAAVFGRVTAASLKSTSGGTSWSPGRAFILEAGGKLAQDISSRASIFAGAALSHWAGPETAPLAGSSVLIATEAGLSVKPGPSPWHVDVMANLTRFTADDERDVATGFVWRLMLGIRRDR